ncbi:hypothetical protein KCQ_05616 [Pectobacterium atrosepticum ICMP 1526]|uniref:hypothetical protein n=1 Tax=Pectobacterium atrosepticum TaxID=29471 RepID=UPI00065DBCB7|nr:hypothetical protein [Pectobacterium atrosepticum]KMK87262.1 hypothetical protein KCQ_05616 [Pectobacterium atrosepticum ICMP 1526]
MEEMKEFGFFYKGDKRISVVCEENNNGFLIYPVKSGNRIHGVSTYINDLSDSSCKEGINKLLALYLELDELSKRSKMSKLDQLRFHKRIVGGGVLISADGYINPITTQSLAEVNVTEPLLYERISQYAYLNGEDLQGMFKTKKFLYMSCFIRDVSGFKSAFGNEVSLNPLFNNDRGGTAEFVISFPEGLNYDDDEGDNIYLLAGEVNNQLSIIVNSIGKDDAEDVIYKAAGCIQSLVQTACCLRKISIDRSPSIGSYEYQL